MGTMNGLPRPSNAIPFWVWYGSWLGLPKRYYIGGFRYSTTHHLFWLEGRKVSKPPILRRKTEQHSLECRHTPRYSPVPRCSKRGAAESLQPTPHLAAGISSCEDTPLESFQSLGPKPSTLNPKPLILGLHTAPNTNAALPCPPDCLM